MRFDQLRRREFITLLGGGAAAWPLTVRAQGRAPIAWRLPSAYPADNFHSENLEAFAKDLTEATGGKVTIRVYANGSLLPATLIKSAVRIGQVQVGEVLLSLYGDENPIFEIDVVPFLADDYDEARQLWAASKSSIVRAFAAQGLMLLFAVPWPPQGLFANKEINDIADMKGLSLRVYNSGSRRIAQIVGADSVMTQAADLPRALATGMIDALITSGATGYDVKAWERMDYFYDIRAWLPKNFTIMNRRIFDQLDKETQETLLGVSAAAEVRGWRWSQDKAEWYKKQLAARGMKVLLPSVALKTGLQQIGERLTGEWLMRAGPEGQAIIDAYRKMPK